MFFSDLFFSILIAFILTIIFGAVFGGRRGYSGLGFFFLILLLATWTGGLWVVPFGPLIWDVSWLSFLTVGFLFALLLLVTLPQQKAPRTKKEALEQAEIEIEATNTFNAFFWIMLIVFAIAIIIAYI